jgi:hypothetical protein
MTSVHLKHAGVIWIADTLWNDGQAAWRELLRVSRLSDCTILALVYSRLRELRDDIAREAFTRQVPFGQVVAERRQARRETKPAQPAGSAAREIAPLFGSATGTHTVRT